MYRETVFARTGLSESDVAVVRAVEAQLPLIAELTGTDVFIDCLTRDGMAVVVAQARPNSMRSLYQNSIIGEYALREKEPAVFFALEKRMPIRDMKATTQENCPVRQDVAPIFSEDGRCVAVLIREKEVGFALLQEKKLRQLELSYAEKEPEVRSNELAGYDDAAIREMHHRVKNSLQIVASILNLQTRQCPDPATQKILQENVARVLSIAAIHDILTQTETGFDQIDSLVLLDRLRQNLQLFIPHGKHVRIDVLGDAKPLESDVASSVSLVVNELVTNALKHAFSGREEGTVQISFRSGSLFDTVTVADDGVGFDPSEMRKGSLGMRLVESIVQDKLHGKLKVYSGSWGSKVFFDFKT